MKLSQMFTYPLFILAALFLQACGSMHSAKSIEAWVVDAKTNQPVEGVIVVAHWQLERKSAYFPGFVGYDRPLQLKILETVTDHEGRFFFPAWGPLHAPSGAYLEGHDPAITIFKPGYEYRTFVNDHPLRFDTSASSTRTSEVNGTTIKLEKFEGDLKVYASNLSSLSNDIRFATSYSNCDWKQVPLMLIAVDKQKRLFRKNNVYSDLPWLDHIDELHRNDHCGSTPKMLKDY